MGAPGARPEAGFLFRFVDLLRPDTGPSTPSLYGLPMSSYGRLKDGQIEASVTGQKVKLRNEVEVFE